MKKLMYIAAALLVLVGCQKKENVIENTPQNLVTITGGIDFSAQDGPNKVAAKEGWENVTSGNQVEFVWEEGDKIAIVNEDMTEIKQFTVTSISEDKQTATFIGEPLSGGMESYCAIYPYEYGEAFFGDIKSFFANQQYSEDLKPYIVGFGDNDSFSMNIFSTIIDLSLTGSVNLGKIVYHLDEYSPQPAYDATLSFGNEGFLLTEQPRHVTFTPYNTRSTGFTLNFYDTDNNLIMSKKSETSLTNVSANYIASFPTLEVKAAPQEVNWTKSLSLGKSDATAIVIETGVDVGSYTEDANHKPLNDDKTLWGVLDGTTLHIQTPPDQINTSLEGLFFDYRKVQTITGLGNIHATTARNMFMGCTALTSIDFTGFNTEDITNMNNMFMGCEALTSLDLSGFNTANVTDMSNMFYDMSYLESLRLSDNFKVASSKSSMFRNCGREDGCTVYGVTDASIKAALSADGTNWGDGDMHFAEE